MKDYVQVYKQTISEYLGSVVDGVSLWAHEGEDAGHVDDAAALGVLLHGGESVPGIQERLN